MATTHAARVPGWFWLVAGLAVLWEAMGVASYVGQAYQLTPMDENQRRLVASTPAWVTGVYAVAVFSGLAGALGLVLRRRWATALLVLSLVAATLQFGWVILFSDALQLLGGSAAILPIAIMLVAALLVAFARSADRSGWLR
jgi:hypothetical protein